MSVSQWIGPPGKPDKYRLARLLDGGGEGELWEAILPIEEMEQRVAVKILSDDHAAERTEWKDRWQRQTEILRSIQHESVVSVREHFEGPPPHGPGETTRGPNRLYLVMNWVEGRTLTRWIADNDRDTKRSLKILAQLASALDHLHFGKGLPEPVIHRDIKPDNVIVDDALHATIIDFGFVRAGASTVSQHQVVSQRYTAPEVVLRNEFGPASDRYSLGITAYYMLRGAIPEVTDLEAVRREVRLTEGVHDRDRFASVFMTILAENPADRPESCSQWVARLEDCLGVSRTEHETFWTASEAAEPAHSRVDAGRLVAGIAVWLALAAAIAFLAATLLS